MSNFCLYFILYLKLHNHFILFIKIIWHKIRLMWIYEVIFCWGKKNELYDIRLMWIYIYYIIRFPFIDMIGELSRWSHQLHIFIVLFNWLIHRWGAYPIALMERKLKWTLWGIYDCSSTAPLDRYWPIRELHL